MPTRATNRDQPAAHGLTSARDFVERLTRLLPFLSWQDALPANVVLLSYHCTGRLTDQQRETVRELSVKVGPIYRTEADLLRAFGCSGRDQLEAALAKRAEVRLSCCDQGLRFVTPEGGGATTRLAYPFSQQDLDCVLGATAARSLAEHAEPA